jgi:hypothetical protein
MKFEVCESRLGEDDVIIAVGLTEEEAERLVAENPKIRIAIPSIINGG